MTNKRNFVFNFIFLKFNVRMNVTLNDEKESQSVF